MTAPLDWQAFSARFFPGRSRHDLQVLKAYEAYRNRFPMTRLDRPGGTEGLRVWEGEGSASQ